MTAASGRVSSGGVPVPGTGGEDSGEVHPIAMTYDHGPTRTRRDGVPFAPPADEDASADGGEPAPAAPHTAPRSDFASSAAMVKDVLAAQPQEEASAEAANPIPPGTVAPAPPASRSYGAEASSDFFSSAKRKRQFWQREVGVRRTRKGAHSEGR